MSDDDNEWVEDAARAFCEASGLYRWADTGEFLRCWYREGARAVIVALEDKISNHASIGPETPAASTP